MPPPAVVALFKAAESPLALLLRAKRESDRRNYAAKHSLLRRLLTERLDEFMLDSAQGGVAGLTHKKTRFRIHIPLRAMPDGARRALSNS